MLTRITSLRAQRYARRDIKIGESFDAKPKDARLLVAVGLAVKTPSDFEKPAKAAAPAKRAYKRRDMTAETVPIELPAVSEQVEDNQAED